MKHTETDFQKLTEKAWFPVGNKLWPQSLHSLYMDKDQVLDRFFDIDEYWLQPHLAGGRHTIYA